MNVPPRPDQVPGTPSPGAISPGQSGLITARTVIIFGSGSGVGLFVYSPTPASGNLVDSIAAASGHDAYGNAYPAGIMSQSSTSQVNINSGQIFIEGLGTLASSSPGGFQIIASNEIEYTAPTDATNVASPELVMKSTATVGMIVTTPLSAVNPAGGSPDAQDPWHNLSLTGTWSGPLRYAMMPWGQGGANFVWLNGTLTAGATFADGTTIGTIGTSAYFPATSQNVPLTTNNALATAGDQSPHLSISTAGVIKCDGIRAAGDILGLNAGYPVN